MPSFRDLASAYSLRIVESDNPHKECKIIAQEINRLVYESNSQQLSLEHRIEIAELIAKSYYEQHEGSVDYYKRSQKIALSNTDFNDFTKEIISFLGGDK